MVLRIFLVLALLVAGVKGASACSFEAQPLKANIGAAKLAFVGTVRTVENGLVMFHIEKIVKGAATGDEFDTDMLTRKEDSCNVSFQPGQRWLYLGDTQPSGSLELQDEMGRPNQTALDAVKAEIGDVGTYSADIEGGTVRESCAPWDGRAFAIALDGGMSASVYVGLNTLDSKDKNTVASYKTDSKQQVGGASIVQCPKADPGKPDNLPCQSRQGTISIGFLTPDDMTGQILTSDGEYHSLAVFHVKRLKDKEICG